MRLSGPGRVMAIVLLAGLTAGCAKAATQDVSSPASVAESFNDYAAAVNAKDGDASADLMTMSSRDYYDAIRDLALDADAGVLAKRSVLDQITVLSMRAGLNVNVLRDANPHQLVKACVEKGLISQNSTATQKLEQIRISGTSATAELVLPGEPASAQYSVHFMLEGDRWHFDVTSLLAPAESAVTQAATLQRMSGRTLVDTVMQTRFGKDRAQTLWTPLGRD